MNKEDKERVIGKVVAINSDRFTIELLTGIDNFNINGYDDIHYFAQLNSYVILPYQNYYIVAEVAGVRERDINSTYSDPKEQFLSKIRTGKYLEVLPIGTLKQNIKSKTNFEFEFGVSVYPALYTDTLYIKETELDTIFNVGNQSQLLRETKLWKDKQEQCPHGENKLYKSLSIGKSTIFPDYDIKIDINKFFGSHAAILGNTGSGKSCTIASIVQGLFQHSEYSATGSTFIFLDTNGEYLQAFSDLSSKNDDIKIGSLKINKNENEANIEEFQLPHWFLNIEEWALLLQATERSQLPILRSALTLASAFEDLATEAGFKNHIVSKCAISIFSNSESPVSAGHRIHALLQNYAVGNLSRDLLRELNFNFQYGNFPQGTNRQQQLLDELQSHIIEDFEFPEFKLQKFTFDRLYEYVDLAILYEESHGNSHIRDYCSTLLTRIQSIRDRPDYNFLKHEEADIKDYKRKLLGLAQNNGSLYKQRQIIIIDLSSVEDEIVEIISCVLSRILYETIKDFEPRNEYPVNLILEEAHRYIGDDPKREFLKANKIFERIAKEGRKFGMFLLVSSQRPSELSRTVLSQCSNFIVHRIQNPEDLSHIRQITPHISDTILKRMPSIPTQHALIFGHAVNLPATFKVNKADPLPLSDNNQISENWFKVKEQVLTTKTGL